MYDSLFACPFAVQTIVIYMIGQPGCIALGGDEKRELLVGRPHGLGKNNELLTARAQPARSLTIIHHKRMHHLLLCPPSFPQSYHRRRRLQITVPFTHVSYTYELLLKEAELLLAQVGYILLSQTLVAYRSSVAKRHVEVHRKLVEVCLWSEQLLSWGEHLVSSSGPWATRGGTSCPFTGLPPVQVRRRPGRAGGGKVAGSHRLLPVARADACRRTRLRKVRLRVFDEASVKAVAAEHAPYKRIEASGLRGTGADASSRQMILLRQHEEEWEQ